MDDCIFCKIIAGNIPADKIYEDDEFVSFLDIKPVNLGHCLLVPKEHHKNLFDMPSVLLEKTGPLLQKISLAVKEATGADGINIGMNNEPAAGQLVFHSHIHIIPRFTEDGLKHWPNKDVTAEQLKNTAGKIREKIN